MFGEIRAGTFAIHFFEHVVVYLGEFQNRRSQCVQCCSTLLHIIMVVIDRHHRRQGMVQYLFLDVRCDSEFRELCGRGAA